MFSKTKITSLIGAVLTACALSAPVAVFADGVNVGKPSALRNLVPAKQLEDQAAVQYADVLKQAAAQNALGGDNDPQVRRIRAIAMRIIPVSNKFNAKASQWRWEVNLIASEQLNAFCMPGGKIAVYSGLINSLKLSDDEIAIVMSHEVAHALREHARARMAKGQLTQLGTSLLGQMIGGGQYTQLFQAGGSLLTLKFSRGDETDADIVGLELAARAGYDPRAGVSLWQKMTAASKGAPPQWLSTHPSGANRAQEIQRHLPEVMPLYEQAKR